MELVISKIIELIIKIIFFALMAYIGIRIGAYIRKNKKQKTNKG